MGKYFEGHKLYQQAYKNKQSSFDSLFLQYKKDLRNVFNRFKDSKILEIGSGMGGFANFCHKIGVKNYVGIDIDDYFFVDNRKDFPDYDFINVGFQEYLKDHQGEFDVIFLSHVFEHLDEKERIEMVTSIHGGLKKGGIWINYMPNADSSLRVGNGRWTDITHKTIYNDVSFAQVVYSCNCNFEIENYNAYIGAKSVLRRIIHLVFLFFTKIYYLGMGQFFPKIYTFEFISILTKK